MATIPICLITDKNYVMPTEVLIQSLLKNKEKNTQYRIIILTDNIDQKSKDELQSLQSNNFDIEVIEIINPYLKLKNINKYVTNSAFLKFDIPFILKDYEKVIYLDVDIIVQHDLSELYDTDLKNTYAGVVEDFTIIKFKKRNKELGLKHYFNSGVLLLNTKKIREEKLNEKMLEIYIQNGENFYCHDQDVLNIAFNDNITILHPKFNWIVANFDFPLISFEKFYKIKHAEYKTENLSVIHYVRMKPWIYSTVFYQKIWQKYYDMCDFKNTIKLKTCHFMNIYYFLRGHLMLKFVDKVIKKIIYW